MPSRLRSRGCSGRGCRRRRSPRRSGRAPVRRNPGVRSRGRDRRLERLHQPLGPLRAASSPAPSTTPSPSPPPTARSRHTWPSPWSPNEDYTTWTITLREGVTFHDDTPLTADAVKSNLDDFRGRAAHRSLALQHRHGHVTGAADGRRVNMHDPWVPFPQYLSSQVGVVMAPSMFDDPDGNANPVGTGPFEFETTGPRTASSRWSATTTTGRPTPTGTRSPTWTASSSSRSPTPRQRKQALDAGDVQVLHTYTVDQITDFRERADKRRPERLRELRVGRGRGVPHHVQQRQCRPSTTTSPASGSWTPSTDDAVIETLFGDTFETADGPLGARLTLVHRARG